MGITFGLTLLAIIYTLWKLFVDGWLYKIILFFAGWFGLWVAMLVWVDGAKNVAITIGTGPDPTTFTWAAVVPTVICFMALLHTKVQE